MLRERSTQRTLNAEPAETAEQINSICVLCGLCVETVSAPSAHSAVSDGCPGFRDGQCYRLSVVFGPAADVPELDWTRW